MSAIPSWRAGFELEVILGDLGEPRFERELRKHGPMDQASSTFCQAFAAKLRERTGRSWSAPSRSPQRPGFYVVPEYGLDPLNWPEDRLAGVELLTPPLPLDDAEIVRTELFEAIYEIDGDFNFFADEHTANCGWHINIDAGDGFRLDPDRFILGVDELLLLANNDRLFSRYTALQRHAVGVPLLRHLAHDPTGKFLLGSALGNLLEAHAGCDKGYAANFAKLLKGYVELRHFSAESFFNGPQVTEQLERILAAFEVWPAHSHPLEQAFRRKFLLLSRWLARARAKLAWNLTQGLVAAEGRVHFDGEPLGHLMANGLVELNLFGHGEYEYIATIRDTVLSDIPEAVALLALDLAEFYNLGIRQRASSNTSFQRAVLQLAAQLRKDPGLSSSAQLDELAHAEKLRREMHPQFYATAGT
ncbi:amidoligase family protein [Sphingobium xenophagum]|uniref:amidoligase family protein n=1 Tax=Sphingobium xenophagum TaxID=121428 RepID=UPI001C0CC3F3|nr:amidoligase family protein [Sphingobium xenophagum]QWT16891.1 amidoligase family protein [Sphingobium xenophagum]